MSESVNSPSGADIYKMTVESAQVFAETGLTPRQLAEQRTLLAEALEGCAHDLYSVTSHVIPHPNSVIGKNLSKAHAALALVKGATP